MATAKMSNLTAIRACAALHSTSLASIGIRLSHALLGYAITITLARHLGAEGFGVYAFSFAAVAIFSAPVQHGLASLVSRETRKFVTSESWTLLTALWRWSDGTGLIASIGLTITVLALFANLSDTGFGSAKVTVWCASPLLALSVIGAVRSAALIGLHRVILGQIPEYVIRPLVFLILFLVAAEVSNEAPLGPTHAMLLQVLAATIALVIASLMLKLARPSGLRGGTRIDESKRWRMALMPMIAVSGVHYVINYSDLIMLGVLGTNIDVGRYRAASQTAFFIPFVLHSVNAVIAPKFAEKYLQNDIRGLQALINSSGVLILTLTLPIALVIALFGKELLDVLFGLEFSGAYSVMLILVIGQIVNVVSGSVTYLMTMTGNERLGATILLYCAVANLILNAIFIPLFGAVGAAAASASSLSIANLIQRWALLNKVKVDSSLVFGRFKQELSR